MIILFYIPFTAYSVTIRTRASIENYCGFFLNVWGFLYIYLANDNNYNLAFNNNER